jgi:hypothetical protein
VRRRGPACANVANCPSPTALRNLALGSQFIGSR